MKEEDSMKYIEDFIKETGNYKKKIRLCDVFEVKKTAK